MIVETKAGHGAGKPTAKVIEEQADIYAKNAKRPPRITSDTSNLKSEI
ncbi:MAG: hypothetical protein KKG06_00220 [Bacteroidetes bacterium]|nr:hypothetical protein [Bacteroidota bacterium]MBU1421603.1 hypothetical protein [Bacteroidota bacterium]